MNDDVGQWSPDKLKAVRTMWYVVGIAGILISVIVSIFEILR